MRCEKVKSRDRSRGLRTDFSTQKPVRVISNSFFFLTWNNERCAIDLKIIKIIIIYKIITLKNHVTTIYLGTNAHFILCQLQFL